MSKSPQKVGKLGDIKEVFGHKRRKRRIYVQEAKEVWTKKKEKKDLCPKTKENSQLSAFCQYNNSI